SRPPTSGKGNGQDGGGHAQATSDAQLPTGEVESAGRHRRSTASSAAPRSVREDFATHGIPPDDGLHCRRRSAYERVAEELRSGHGYLPREPSARYRSPQINAHDVRHYEALPSPSTSSSYVFSSRLRRSRTRFGSPSERFYLAQIHPALFTKHVSRCGASSLVRAAVLSPTWSHEPSSRSTALATHCRRLQYLLPGFSAHLQGSSRCTPATIGRREIDRFGSSGALRQEAASQGVLRPISSAPEIHSTAAAHVLLGRTRSARRSGLGTTEALLVPALPGLYVGDLPGRVQSTAVISFR
ncbi:unnamed protein product, partial [Adineta ricciae]